MILETCNEKCGYAAAFIAAVCLGSFGVPVKSEVVTRLDVDPLVMQTYKTAMCFLTCWLIIPLGEPCRFTPWGIVSGLFWVPGGWAGIFAIRTAGLAVAKGTWSSIIVLTSFAWGIFVFEERVKTISGACCACATLITGLIGMSYFSRPQKITKTKSEEEGIEMEENSDHETKVLSSSTERVAIRKGFVRDKHTTTLLPIEMESLIGGKDSGVDDANTTNLIWDFCVLDYRIVLTKRQAGILASIFNGLWGGTNMIPLHFAAKEGYGGPSYVISFACGAALVNTVIWLLRYLFELYRLNGAVGRAYCALPSFHSRELWHLGCFSGLLWSMGNAASIIAVTFLGQGIGYSFTQTSMLISGLWGILVFEEISRRDRILMWLVSASVTVLGILWLSYEHG